MSSKNYKIKIIRKLIPLSLENLIRKSFAYRLFNLKTKRILDISLIDDILNEAPKLFLNSDIIKKPVIGIIKECNELSDSKYVKPKASWLRYERFCKNNDIPYEFYDIRKSNWIEESKKFDIIICHTPSTPEFQEMFESKFYILEKVLGKMCFPNYHELWQYENKNRANYLYQILNIPNIPTYVTNSKEEAIEIVSKINYPFITKTTIGSGSRGVKKINSKRQALTYIDKIFGYKGFKTEYPYQRQKDYIYIQEFIDDATFDLRVMLIGNKAFGYYRYPNKGDFRASGAGNTEKKPIPKDALLLAIEVRNKLKSRQMGVDMLYSEKNKKYYIIETSLFNQIDTPIQLEIDGMPGYYDISDINNITFKEGKFWVQELLLRDVIEDWNMKNCNNVKF